MDPRHPDPWREYRRRKRLMILVALAGLVLFGAGVAVARAHRSAKPFYVGLAVCVGMVAWTSTALSEFPCPRCGEPFHYRGRSRNLFARKCMHCQLPKGTLP